MTREEFYKKEKTGKLSWKKCPHEERIINPNDIIVDKNWNAENKNFWNHHGYSKEEYMDYVSSGKADNSKPIPVYECGDKYVLVDDGNHRVAAAQELNRPIIVNVTGKYIEQNQEQDYEEEMSM